MRIAVCIKQVPISEQVEVDQSTQKLIRENAECDINSCDLNAMECALQIKSTVECSIDVYTMGPALAEKALRKCLAMGADHAYLLCDKKFAGADTLGTARVLAKAMELNGEYDLIFTGNESSDGATGQVGPMLAEFLHIPDVAETTQIRIEENNTSAMVRKKIKSGTVLLQVDLPALFTIPFGCNEPHLPTLRSQMKANKREVIYMDQSKLHLPEEVIGLTGALSIVTDVVPNKVKKSAVEINGTSEEIAKQIYQLIEKEMRN